MASLTMVSNVLTEIVRKPSIATGDINGYDFIDRVARQSHADLFMVIFLASNLANQRSIALLVSEVEAPRSWYECRETQTSVLRSLDGYFDQLSLPKSIITIIIARDSVQV